MSTPRHPYLFYYCAGGADSARFEAASDDYRCVYWRPRLARIWPGRLSRQSVAWWLMHQLRVFRNRDYAQLLIYDETELIHRSHVFPGWFRFPFMHTNDLQIGNTWTRESHRGRGLAALALTRIVETAAAPGRAFWYVTGRDNSASVRAVEKAGFRLVGEGDRTARLGTLLLGAFVITHSLSGDNELKGRNDQSGN